MVSVVSGHDIFDKIIKGHKQEVTHYPMAFVMEGAVALLPITTNRSTHAMTFIVNVIDKSNTLSAGRISVLNKAGKVKDALENDRGLSESVRNLEIVQFLPNYDRPRNTFYRWECAVVIRCFIER